MKLTLCGRKNSIETSEVKLWEPRHIFCLFLNKSVLLYQHSFYGLNHFAMVLCTLKEIQNKWFVLIKKRKLMTIF